jgi:hypothetical protein
VTFAARRRTNLGPTANDAASTDVGTQRA